MISYKFKTKSKEIQTERPSQHLNLPYCAYVLHQIVPFTVNFNATGCSKAEVKKDEVGIFLLF